MRSSGWGWGVVLLLLALRVHAHEPASGGGNMARILFFKKRVGGATSYAAEAQLGLAYLDRARAKKSRSCYHLAARHLLNSLAFQRNFDGLLGLAMICSDLHQFEQGLRYAEEASTVLPGHPDLEGVKCDLYMAVGQTERAAAIVRTMRQRQPGFAAWSRQANLLDLRGDSAGAIEAMQRARAEAHALPRPVQAWTNGRLALLLARAGDQGAAMKACEKALELDPGDQFATEMRSRLLADQGDLAQATTLARWLVRRHGDMHSRLLLADLLAAGGDIKDSEAQRKQVLQELRHKAATGDRTELRQLALVLLDRDETIAEGLLVAWDEWFHRQDPFTADLLAWAYYRNGRLTEAVPLSNRALEIGTQDPRLLLHAALIKRAVGEHEAAAKLRETAVSSRFLLSRDEQRWLSSYGDNNNAAR